MPVFDGEAEEHKSIPDESSLKKTGRISRYPVQGSSFGQGFLAGPEVLETGFNT